MAELTFSQVDELLKYDPETGKLFWKERTPDLFSSGMFTAEVQCHRWNKVFAGKEAFTADRGDGYRVGAIFCKTYRAHRIAWLLFYGSWPEDQIDHINGCRGDNRIINLRQATDATNRKNQKRRADNTSGVTGVSWHAGRSKWMAFINSDGRHFHLGLFDELDQAIAKRKIAENNLQFHENHGR